MLYLEDKQEPEGREEMLELGRRKDPMSREHLLNEKGQEEGAGPLWSLSVAGGTRAVLSLTLTSS
jgi:hypothetical protein